MTELKDIRITKKDFVLFIFFGILTIVFFSWVSSSYKIYHPKLISQDQSNYFEIEDLGRKRSTELVFKSELGLNQNLIDLGKLPAQTNVDFKGFNFGDSWHRPISWHLNSPAQASIELKFPSNSLNQVAIYFTDGDSIWRMSMVKTDDKMIGIDKLHNGRWVFFPISEEENEFGQKYIEFNRLTGNGVSISGLALFSNKLPK